MKVSKKLRMKVLQQRMQSKFAKPHFDRVDRRNARLGIDINSVLLGKPTNNGDL